MADNKITIGAEIDGKEGFKNFAKEAELSGLEAGKALVDSFEKNILNIKTVFAAAIGSTIAVFTKTLIDAAREQAAAIREVENALTRVGAASESNIKFFEHSAEALAATTKNSESYVLSLQAQAINYARTTEQAQKLVKAAIDLSAITGDTAASLVDRLGLSLQGVNSRLNRLIPGFVGLNQAALQSGAALNFVEEHFGGAAQAKYVGLGAALDQVGKAFHEVEVALGLVILKSGGGEFLRGIATAALEAANHLKEMANSGELLAKIVGFAKEVGAQILILATSFATAYAIMNPSKLAVAFRTSFAQISASWTSLATTIEYNIGIFQLARAEGMTLGQSLKLAFLSGELGAKAFQVAIQLAEAAATLGLTVAIQYLIGKFYEFKSAGLDVGDSIKAVFLTIYESIQSLLATLFTALADAVSKLPGIGKTLAEPFRFMADSAKAAATESADSLKSLVPVAQETSTQLADAVGSDKVTGSFKNATTELDNLRARLVDLGIPLDYINKLNNEQANTLVQGATTLQNYGIGLQFISQLTAENVLQTQAYVDKLFLLGVQMTDLQNIRVNDIGQYAQLADTLTRAGFQLDQFSSTSQQTLQAVSQAAQQTTMDFRNVIAQGLSKGTQELVKALQKGKNGFEAFSKSVLSIFGNALITIGENFVLIGIMTTLVRASLGSLQGGPAIAAGLALIIAGTLLNSLGDGSGGGETSPSGASGFAGGGGGGLSATTTEVAPTEAAKPKTEVVVNVQGNVFNGAEQARTIAENLQEYFDTNNGLLVRS